MYVSPVAYVVPCVRFTYLPLFTYAAVKTTYNAPPGAQHSVRVVGQTLQNHSFDSSRPGLSPEKKRHDTLRLSHQRRKSPAAKSRATKERRFFPSECILPCYSSMSCKSISSTVSSCFNCDKYSFLILYGIEVS